ncbi:lipase family protein [Gottfriedia acidiceleris]|uniref:lipase family protein n=1 Tax=Gottfriedia acidiceleris TaxID=371036 RepID=UPI00101C90B4|nr:lipase family protein [Gottfriedia acidiceleris]
MNNSRVENIFNSKDAILLAAMCYQSNQLIENEKGEIILPRGFELRHIIYAFAGVEEPEAEPFGFLAESKNEIVIAFRGTDSFKDNESDQDLYQVDYPFVENVGKTHRGFTCIYQSARNEMIRELMKLSPNKKLLITGYSLGGALAVLSSFDIAVNTDFENPSVYTFGSPRVADPEFAYRFNQIVWNSVRIFNVHDIIPTLPAEAYPPPFTAKGLYYQHVNNKYPVSFQLNSIARNHYIGCYFNTISRLDPVYTNALCFKNPGFCPNEKICVPYKGNCVEKNQ